jgi:hypothetical protein
MLLIESRTDEDVKRHAAQHCNEDFMVPMLLYSPAVGAGLDFTMFESLKGPKAGIRA